MLFLLAYKQNLSFKPFLYLAFSLKFSKNKDFNVLLREIRRWVSKLFKTFKNPLFVLEQTREGSTKPSVYFYKPFYDENKKLLNLFANSLYPFFFFLFFV